jgi:hypothetical protein
MCRDALPYCTDKNPLWLGFNSDWGDNILGFLDNTFGYHLGHMFSFMFTSET